MPDEIERKLVDKRVVERYLRKGRLDEKDLEKHLRALPDLSDQAVPVVSQLEDDFDDDEPEESPDEQPAAPPAAAAPQTAPQDAPQAAPPTAPPGEPPAP